MTIRAKVEAFHRAAGHPVVDYPTIPPRDRLKLRLRCIAEEFCELFTACGFRENVVAGLRAYVDSAITYQLEGTAEGEVDLVAVADALADIDYFVEGTRLELGIDGEPVLAEVQRSNMQKFECEGCRGAGYVHVGDGVWPCQSCDDSGKNTKRREDGKVLKPAHWTPPDIEKVLVAQGMRERRGVPHYTKDRWPAQICNFCGRIEHDPDCDRPMDADRKKVWRQ